MTDARNIFSILKEIPNGSKQFQYVHKIMHSVTKRIKGNRSSQCNVSNEETSRLLVTSTSSDSEWFDAESEYTRDNLTIDSGVITLKEAHVPKPSTTRIISFSPDVVNIERYQSKYHDLKIKKCIARITETPKSQKVEYIFIRNSTRNLIKNTGQRESLELSPIQSNFARKSIPESVFVRKQSTKWKRRAICFPETFEPLKFMELEMAQELELNTEQDSSETIYSEPWVDRDGKVSETFKKLKKKRDMVSVRMIQSSNALKMIRTNHGLDWSDELVAEKILLETHEKYKLIVNEIQDLGYIPTAKNSLHPVTATFSNFEFLLETEEDTQRKYSTFFILTLSHGTQLLMSKATPPQNKKISFGEKFTFIDLHSDFMVILKIFTITLNTRGRHLGCCFKKTTNLSTMYYENVNTSEKKESTVLEPSFTCAAESSFTKAQIGSSHLILSNIADDYKLVSDVAFTFNVDRLKVNSNMSGFLTLGRSNQLKAVLYWERMWCTLQGMKLSMYNYPTEVDCGKPVLSIDLEYCLVPIQTEFTYSPRKRSFLIKAGRPSTINEDNDVALKEKSHFVLEKYFFSADSHADFQFWTTGLQTVLYSLWEWKQLVFGNDYYY